MLMAGICSASIDWQKIKDYINTHDVTLDQAKTWTAPQVANALGVDDPNEIKLAVSEIRQVVKEEILMKERKEKFLNIKAFIIDKNPEAVVTARQVDGEWVIVIGGLL